MIRQCKSSEFDTILEIVNDGASAYRGVIPADCWHYPYMSTEELCSEIADGVVFWAYEQDGELLGVMGLQRVQDVSLIRHAYVRTDQQRTGIGGRLLNNLIDSCETPLLVGTWADASWAIRFYEKNGFALVDKKRKVQLLHKYWTVPERQIEVSVVLAK